MVLLRFEWHNPVSWKLKLPLPRGKHIKGARAHYGQILAYQISYCPVDVDQLPKYGAVHVKAYCFYKVIPLKGLYIVRIFKWKKITKMCL